MAMGIMAELEIMGKRVTLMKGNWNTYKIRCTNYKAKETHDPLRYDYQNYSYTAYTGSNRDEMVEKWMMEAERLIEMYGGMKEYGM